MKSKKNLKIKENKRLPKLHLEIVSINKSTESHLVNKQILRKRHRHDIFYSMLAKKETS